MLVVALFASSIHSPGSLSIVSPAFYESNQWQTGMVRADSALAESFRRGVGHNGSDLMAFCAAAADSWSRRQSLSRNRNFSGSADNLLCRLGTNSARLVPEQASYSKGIG